MPLRTFKSSNDALPNATSYQLPTDRPVAVYYRQSTAAQVGNISTTVQTVDMVEELMRRGWPQNHIIMIDMDAGISGTLRIDERAGMKYLVSLIEDGLIGAVATQDEDRLFRDVTQIQVNIFINACERNHVQVLTPAVNYIFHHPDMGGMFKQRFRLRCEMAAEYLDYMRLRMGKARAHMRREGKWAGAATPLGYMVSDETRKYVPFPPYDDFIRAVFEAMIRYGGNSRRAHRSLQERGLLLPETVVVPDGYKVKGHHRGHLKTRLPAPRSLPSIVSNPVYLGHWMMDGEIVVWNNHPPLVDEATFFAAFNLVSPYALDGSPNPHYRRIRAPRQTTPRADAYQPLLAGLIRSQMPDRWVNVTTEWVVARQIYGYTAEYKHPHTLARKRWLRDAEHFDSAVIGVFLDKLEATLDPDLWEQAALEEADAATAELQRLERRLADVEAMLQNMAESIPQMRLRVLIEKAEAQYGAAQAERQRLQTERALLLARRTERVSIPPLDFLHTIRAHWPAYAYDDRRAILLDFIEGIDVIDVQPRGPLTMTVLWALGEPSTVVLPMQPKGDKRSWSRPCHTNPVNPFPIFL